MALAGHAMRQTLEMNLRPVLDQPDHRDVIDGLNEEPVLVIHSERKSPLMSSSRNLLRSAVSVVTTSKSLRVDKY
jgi:hypothetical protein